MTLRIFNNLIEVDDTGVLTATVVKQNNSKLVGDVLDLDDDDYVDLPAGTEGMGWCVIDHGAVPPVWAFWGFKTDATVNLIVAGANVVNSDTDAKFCIFNAGSNTVRLKNRLGSTKNLVYQVRYQ